MIENEKRGVRKKERKKGLGLWPFSFIMVDNERKTNNHNEQGKRRKDTFNFELLIMVNKIRYLMGH